ncbi:cupin domain-containing protein [bacterium]|nr:cupin domain-containing protein [bacterium]
MATRLRLIVLGLGLLAASASDGLAQTTTGARDSLRTRPRLGGGRYIDGVPARGGEDAAAFAPGETGAAEAAPSLPFAQTRLQELLQRQPLREDENARRTPIFSADSLLAVALYQLRGEEPPHYFPLSDVWIYIWRGRGRLQRAAGESAYGPGELLQIPAGELHALANESGAPTVALVWQWPPIDDSLTVTHGEAGADSLAALRRGSGQR